MLAVAILAIVVSFAVPSFARAIEKRNTIGAAEALYSQIQLARSESIARSRPVFMNIVGGADWAVGFGSDQNCDPLDNNPACTLPDLEGNNAITHLLKSVDVGNVSVTTTANQLAFMPQRGMVNGATINIASQGNVGYVITLSVSMLGQVSLCSPNADPSRYITGYRPCI